MLAARRVRFGALRGALGGAVMWCERGGGFWWMWGDLCSLTSMIDGDTWPR